MELVKNVLQTIYDELDRLQELDEVQEKKELMYEIGEAMGSIDNAIDAIDNPSSKLDLLCRHLVRFYRSASIWDSNEPYVEVRFDEEIDGVKKDIKDFGFNITQEYWAGGSNYDAYYIWIEDSNFEDTGMTEREIRNLSDEEIKELIEEQSEEN